MPYGLIKVSALPEATPNEAQDIVVGVGDYAKRINYGDVKADMVGTSPSYTTDTEPYLMRQTAHVGVVGKCALEKLVGGSLGWNQLNNYGQNSGTNNGVTYTKTASGWAVSGTASSPKQSQFRTTTDIPCVSGHRYLCIANAVLSTNGLYVIIWRNNSATRTASIGQNAAESFVMFTGGSDWTNLNIWFHVPAGKTASNTNLVVNLIDLTAEFGSTIADYIYSLESATAGSGIAWLSKYIDLDTYHAYDAGSIQSVQTTAHVTKDANDNVIGNYPLGSDTLRGIPTLVSNKLKYDGDEKYPDGTIRRKYGIVDLGTLTYTGGSGGFVLSESIGAKVQPTQAVMAKIICSKYPTIMQSQLSGSDKCVYGLNWGNGIGIRDSAYSTPAAFKTAMSGVYLVYELATETTESSTSYQKVQTIDADGTESFTTSTPVPVGHDTQTPDNILAALGWLGE